MRHGPQNVPRMTSMRQDPYSGFRFKVKWDGRYVAGVNKISALRRSTDVVEHREGGQPGIELKSPGRTKFEPITLERGVTQDRAFEEWANSVWKLAAIPETSIAKFRKDIEIDVFNEADEKVLSYLVYRCWVSEYQALPDLDANADAVAVEHIKLENEGWERDTSVVPPPDDIA
jgi:phage tail-like protein